MGVLSASADILLIEDSPGDVRLTREAIKDAGAKMTLHVVSDGVDAIAFLNRTGKHENACRPDLILLDLNLPKKDGRTVLAEIKRSPELQAIPVVILTTSAAQADVMKSYLLHANCYIVKPVSLTGFVKVIKSIDDFWLCVAELPTEPGL